ILVRIASWNVNSIKAHIVNVLTWLRAAKPDAVLLQEIKVTDDAFPRLEIEDLGYNVAVGGQRTYNGGGILSKHPLANELSALPGGDGDTQARYIEGLIEVPRSSGAGHDIVRVASIYLPNGNPADSDKFPYKLAWMDRLRARARELLGLEEMLVLGG